MMRITPLDIRKQEFRKVMRGLDAEEVFAFLTTVADEYEAVLNDNKALKDRLLELDDKVQEYRNMEKTLRNTLLTAERVNVEAKENARREAGIIVKEAQIEAEKALRNVKNEQMILSNSIKDLKRQKENYLSRIKMLAETHLKFIESAEEEFEEEDKAIASMPGAGGDKSEALRASGAPAAADERIESEVEEFAEIKREKRTPLESKQAIETERERAGVRPHQRPEAAGAASGPGPVGINPPSGPHAPPPVASSPSSPAIGAQGMNEILDEMAAQQKETLKGDGRPEPHAFSFQPEEPQAPGFETDAGVSGAGSGSAGFSSEGADKVFGESAIRTSDEPRGASVMLQSEESSAVSPSRPHDAEKTGKRKKDASEDSTSSEEWSLEKLKRDILSSASGEDEKN
jgi:cell division initiation protein